MGRNHVLNKLLKISTTHTHFTRNIHLKGNQVGHAGAIALLRRDDRARKVLRDKGRDVERQRLDRAWASATMQRVCLGDVARRVANVRRSADRHIERIQRTSSARVVMRRKEPDVIKERRLGEVQRREKEDEHEERRRARIDEADERHEHGGAEARATRAHNAERTDRVRRRRRTRRAAEARRRLVADAVRRQSGVTVGRRRESKADALHAAQRRSRETCDEQRTSNTGTGFYI